MKFFFITFRDPNKRGPQTAAVQARTSQWASEKFLIANSDVTILRVS